MDGALRDPFAVRVGELLEQLVILQQYRCVPPGGDRTLIVPVGAAAVVVNVNFSLIADFQIIDALSRGSTASSPI
jgi:hypothetical protein